MEKNPKKIIDETKTDQVKLDIYVNFIKNV